MKKMKYKTGDLVRIKSLQWWSRQYFDNFPKFMALGCCGKIGEIVKEQTRYTFLYKTEFGNNNWLIDDDWIKEKVKKINVPLKYMKNGEI